MAKSLQSLFPMFFDVDGNPLEGGSIYFGAAGLNPLSNPQLAYWDEALTIPAANVKISGGYVVNNGAPGRIFFPGDFSTLVADKNGKVVYSRMNGFFESEDSFVTETRGTLTRAARNPSSFNFDLILESGFYTWTSALTTNFPATSAAADMFALTVINAPDGSGSVFQSVADLTLTPVDPDFIMVRSSLDAGATWTAWANPVAAEASALITATIGAGTILPFAGLALPSGFLRPDGSAVSKSTYSAMYSAISSSVRGTAGTGAVAFADATDLVTCAGHGFAVGDCVHFSVINSTTGILIDTNYFVTAVLVDTFGVSASLSLALAGTKLPLTTNGTGSVVYTPWGISGANNFLLPDMREASVYGSGTRGSGVTEHDIIALGAFGDDRAQEHLHTLGPYATTAGAGTGVAATQWSGLATSYGNATGTTSAPTTSGANGTPRTGKTTRGKVVSVNFIIKY